MNNAMARRNGWNQQAQILLHGLNELCKVIFEDPSYADKL